MNRAEAIQRRYYAETASRYDAMHVDPGDEHSLALRFISGLVRQLNLQSVLDVGSGTGRALEFFAREHPGLEVRGVEPVAELIDQGSQARGLARDLFVSGRGEALPFPDNSFDVVCEFAVLHHVADPRPVVSEMIRVARRAVFLSDENRFGHGHPALRMLKLGLYMTRLWPLADWGKTRGRGYRISEGDGLSYSYSVYDSVGQLDDWAERLFLIPLAGGRTGRWTGPLLTAPSILVCALRDP